jgi:hypothetical protein
MWSLILKAAVQYLEAHPDQVANLLEQGVEAGINALKKHNAAQPKA